MHVLTCAPAAAEGLYEVSVRDEEANLWELYLHRGDYAAAFRHCRSQVLASCAACQLCALPLQDTDLVKSLLSSIVLSSALKAPCSRAP